jgi:hypothetical protein
MLRVVSAAMERLTPELPHKRSGFSEVAGIHGGA